MDKLRMESSILLRKRRPRAGTHLRGVGTHAGRGDTFAGRAGLSSAGKLTALVGVVALHDGLQLLQLLIGARVDAVDQELLHRQVVDLQEGGTADRF